MEEREVALAEEEFETNLRDFEEMIENEGWMYLYELGFSTWDDYERFCVSDAVEERAEEDQNAFWEGPFWEDQFDELEDAFGGPEGYAFYDSFGPFDDNEQMHEQQDHERELDQAERNADRELDIGLEEYEAEMIQRQEDADWDCWEESTEAGFSTWEDYVHYMFRDEVEERVEVELAELREMEDYESWEQLMENTQGYGSWAAYEFYDSLYYDPTAELALLEEDWDQEERNADREANYEPEDDREWVLNVYGLRLHHWSYEPGDPDADEYFELLYRYNCLLGLA